MQWFIDNHPEFRESLRKFHYFLRDSFKVPFPTTAGSMMHLGDVAAEISRRLSRLFLPDADGRRPAGAGTGGEGRMRYGRQPDRPGADDWQLGPGSEGVDLAYQTLRSRSIFSSDCGLGARFMRAPRAAPWRPGDRRCQSPR